MKRLISLLLCGTLLLGAAGCSNAETSAGSASPAPAGSQAPGQSGAPAGASDYSDVKIAVILSGPPTDGGYCQQGSDGVKAIQAKYGLDDSQVAIIDSVTTAETARAEAENLADEGYTVVFGQGGQFADYFKEVAQDYPDTWFVTNGGSVTGPNQFPMCMSNEEGGYVCGVIAGMMTQSDQLGVIVCGDTPSYTKPGVGFALGAKSVNPDVKVSQVVLSAANSNEAYETAMSMVNSGTDFIFPNADAGNVGAIKAVSENEGVYSFGIFGDYIESAPQQVIGNMMPDAPGAYVAAFDAIMASEAGGEVMFLGMAQNIINFTWNEEVKATLPEEVVAAAEQAIEDFRSGALTIDNEYDIGEKGSTSYFS